MPFRHKILRIWIIYALLAHNFVVKIYALFRRFFRLKGIIWSADLFAFRMYVDKSVPSYDYESFRAFNLKTRCGETSSYSKYRQFENTHKICETVKLGK